MTVRQAIIRVKSPLMVARLEKVTIKKITNTVQEAKAIRNRGEINTPRVVRVLALWMISLLTTKVRKSRETVEGNHTGREAATGNQTGKKVDSRVGVPFLMAYKILFHRAFKKL